jgi:NADPH:quinone reductase-like Zn-dependent oxidoreductase
MFKASAEEQRRCADRMNDLFKSKKLRARIDRVMALSETAEAHRIQQASTVGLSNELSGKLVLTC